MTNKTLDLMRKYSVDIADMCKGTALQGKEGKCVRFKLANGDYEYVGSLAHFVYLSDAGTTLEFCVAVLEDKPVFELDGFYFKNSGNTERCYVKDGHLYANEGLYKHIDEVNFKLFTWNKPTPKHTFNLNGVELPCPVKDSDDSATKYLFFFGTDYRFKSVDDRNSVIRALKKLLEEAQNK